MIDYFYQWLNHFRKIIHKSENCSEYHSFQNHILIIDRHIPFFDKDAGSYRMYNILKIVSELGYFVTFIGNDLNHFDPYYSILEQTGIRVVNSSQIKSIKRFLSQNGQYFKIVILSRPDVAKKHIDNVCKYCKNAKIIYDTVDLRFLRLQRNAELTNDIHQFRKAAESKKLEMDLARKADTTLVVSSYEKNLLLNEDSSLNIQILSLIYPLSYPKKLFFNRRDILFLGGFQHSPNVDGVEWFVNESFPIIQEKIPGIKFFIVGDNPPKEILSLWSEDVVIMGYISDLTEFFENSRVFVAPLRYGAGIKGKICHSMSYGLPVVTTSIGAEGLGIMDGHQALIADTPIDFAEKVIRLYSDEALWYSISKNSIAHIMQNYSYEKSKKDITILIKSLF